MPVRHIAAPVRYQWPQVCPFDRPPHDPILPVWVQFSTSPTKRRRIQGCEGCQGLREVVSSRAHDAAGTCHHVFRWIEIQNAVPTADSGFVIKEGTYRRELPKTRNSKTFEFTVADVKGYFTVGEYDDGTPGEIFMRVSKQGSTLAGIMDALAISVSHGLQYGVPLTTLSGALTRDEAGRADGPLGLLLDELVVESAEV